MTNKKTETETETETDFGFKGCGKSIVLEYSGPFRSLSADFYICNY